MGAHKSLYVREEDQIYDFDKATFGSHESYLVHTYCVGVRAPL